MGSQFASLTNDCVKKNLEVRYQILRKDVGTGQFIRLNALGNPDLEENTDYKLRLRVLYDRDEDSDPQVQFQDVQLMARAGDGVSLWRDAAYASGKEDDTISGPVHAKETPMRRGDKTGWDDLFFRLKPGADTDAVDTIVDVRVLATTVPRGKSWTPIRRIF